MISDLKFSRSISLSDLLRKANIKEEFYSPVITGLCYDSRLIKKGDLFFAVKGAHVDGHDFLEHVAKKGAVAAVVERDVSANLPLINVPSVLVAMSKISDLFFGSPSQQIPVIGITGTNGKTTTTFLIEDVYHLFRKKCGVLGTVNYRIGQEVWPAPNTTPMSLDVHEFIYKSQQEKAESVVMEVSSHALELSRVNDVRFDVAVFTNLTQDHLDFHSSMENYFLAKSKLFLRPENPKAVVNIDDTFGTRLAQSLQGCLTYGFQKEAQLRAEQDSCDLEGIKFEMVFPSGRRGSIHTNLLGRHNIYNCLSAAGALLARGISEEEIIRGLNQSHAVPGRLERVEMGQDFVVAIDYAHTEDALAQVLKTLRNAGPQRLICIFGAGGDRDRTKRPKMGSVATTLADFVYVTSDNPRSEKPANIMKDIEDGIKKSGKTNYVMIEDRTEAIHQAIRDARKGDIILIAGKGHENYQIIGDKKFPFSDFDVSKEALSPWK